MPLFPNGFKKPTLGSLFIILAIGANSGLDISSLIFIYTPNSLISDETTIFIIKKGEGIREIAASLKKDGFINNEFSFLVYSFLTGKATSLQAGPYRFSSPMNIPEIVNKLASGETAKEFITIVEGWNLEEISDYLYQKNIFRREPLLKFFESVFPQDLAGEFAFLKEIPEGLDFEGYLFPDTYEIEWGSSHYDFTRKALQNFDRRLTLELRQEINRRGKKIFDIVIMASMLEREVKTPEDKKLVSGILWKRLRVGMPLQVDATIVYLLDLVGEKKEQLSAEDLKIDSSYNTYKYKGLPRGPICNPGIESILAAIYPQESDFWYYLSKPNGETVFSKTYEDHLAAKQEYLED